MGGRAGAPARGTSHVQLLHRVSMAAHRHHISKLPTPGSLVALPGFERCGLGQLVALAESADLLGAGPVPLDQAVAFAIDRTASAGLIAPASLATFARTWRGFARFARLACDAPDVPSVDSTVVARFMRAPTATKRAPSPATQQLRRTALRFLFRLLRDNGLANADPTLDLDLPGRPSPNVRPLTTAEVERCRLAAAGTLTATREPAAWALLETGGSAAEAGTVRFCDLRLDVGMVVLGHDTSAERPAPLSAWGVAQLRRREGQASEWVLVGSAMAGYNARRTRASELVRNAMRRAGVTGPGISARSVTAWAGACVLTETGRIEDVARRLGMGSLDVAAALIDHQWDQL
ncbi:MAG: integrase [Acidimicrobiales bacterium]|nr:integrase [Acidimicrobiales bacterium]